MHGVQTVQLVSREHGGIHLFTFLMLFKSCVIYDSVDLQDSLSQNNIATYICTRTIISCTQPLTSSLSSSEKVTATSKGGIGKHLWL